ncbi:MAG: phospholipase D-like domain-containing protein [Candidatus Neomarinimicrobiota bacterium]
MSKSVHHCTNFLPKKYLLTAIFIVLIFGSSANFQIPSDDFEIVESIPVGTILDNPEIRNTTPVWLELIGAAKKSLDIEQFYIANQTGEPLDTILTTIVQAANRGVKIRIIADLNMSKTYPESLERLKQVRNIDVRIIGAFAKNGVQHSKYFIVDREIVFLGSQNFDWRSLKHIHEIGVKIRHSGYAQAMTGLFEFDWKQSQVGRKITVQQTEPPMSFNILSGKADTIRFYPTASPFDDIPNGFQWDETAIVAAIDRAKKSVYVQLLSYTPSERNGLYDVLDNALRRAAARGVDVRLLVSDWCQKKYEMPFLKNLTILPNIEVKLSTIPEYEGGYISFARVEHCKMMTVDDSLTWIGTSNWSRGYFYDSRNVGLVIRNGKINETVKSIFLKSWDGPYSWTIRPEIDYKPKFYGEKD